MLIITIDLFKDLKAGQDLKKTIIMPNNDKLGSLAA
jgi:hypothetical protein